MSISIEEKLKQINTMNIASISDTGALQELASIAEELINSSNPAHRFAALKIKNRLEQNDHYKELLKANLIQKEEVKATAFQQFERAYQAHRETASTANLQSRRQEEAKESKATEEAFNKLTTQQQQAIIKLEYLYLPELRQQVREFILDDTKATPENFAGIINKQIKSEAVLVEKDKDGNEYITLSEDTTTEKANEIEHIAQQTGDAAIEAGKMKPAVVAYSTVDAAGVQVANNQMKAYEDNREEAARVWRTDVETIKTGQAATSLYDEVFQKHIDNLKELEGMSDAKKEMRLAQYENSLAENIEKFFNTHKVDLSTPEKQKDFIASLIGKAQVDLANGDISAEQLKQILVKNCNLDPNIVNEAIDEQVKTIKAVEEMADEIDTPEPAAPKKEYESPLILMNHYNKGESGPIPNAPTFEKDVEPKIRETYEEEKEKELANTNTNQNKATAATATQVAIVVDNSNK
ncbi:hypothetical protein ACLSYX_11080 [[Pasteurella] aerogenes]